MEGNCWKIVKIFGSEVRVQILRLLLKGEIASLSDILRLLEKNYGIKLTISGLFKHMKVLEKTGLIRHESGGLALKEPDARKTIYLIENKERVQRILKLEEQVVAHMRIALMFKKASEIAREIRGIGPAYEKERKLLEAWLEKLEKERELGNLTEEEEDKIKLWKIITKYKE